MSISATTLMDFQTASSTGTNVELPLLLSEKRINA